MKADDMLDHTPIKQGKYKGQTPDQISDHDPSYVVWMYANWNPKPCSKLLAEACQLDMNEDSEDDTGVPDTYEKFKGDFE